MNSVMMKLTLKNLYWFLLLILPFMDTANGVINNGGNDGGISLGIVYRIIMICFFSLYLCK